MSDIMPGQPGDTNTTFKNAREFAEAVAELGALAGRDGRDRAYDLMGAIANYCETGAREKAINDAIEAARGEYLTDDTGTDEDAAYNNGVTDAIAAVSALLEGGAR